MAQVLGAATLVLAVAQRPRKCLVSRMTLAAIIGGLTAIAAHWVLDELGVAGEPAPGRVWLWVALTGTAAATVVAGWLGAHWCRRNLAVFAASMCLLSTGLAINQWIGYFPTVHAAWNQLTDGPLPDETDRATLAALQEKGIAPPSGALVRVSIDASASRFAHREEFVYLPPAWFASRLPPRLPTIMMIAGEFHTPADWVRIGEAVGTLDAFAARNAGHAPVAVFVDSGGSFGTDTECVNGPRGNAADHLIKDVVPFMIVTFGVSPRRDDWGVAGFSAGGTCALDLAVMHPERFAAFVDIAGDHGPNAGTKAQTIDRLFGGDADAWASFDPTTVMTRHGPYQNVSGLVAAPGLLPVDDRGHVGQRLDDGVCAVGRAHGISCHVVTLRGRHDWLFAAAAFATTLPWLAAQVGTLGTSRGEQPPLSTASSNSP